MCETNKSLVKGSEWVNDERVDVAVLFVNEKMKMNVTHVNMGKGYGCFSLENCDVSYSYVCSYIVAIFPQI